MNRSSWKRPWRRTPISPNSPQLTRIVFEGPAGEDPINALPPLRQRPLSDVPTTFQQFQNIPLPQLDCIRPRGVDEKDNTEGNEIVEPISEPKEKP